MTRTKKTKYCTHYRICDRKENCFKGQYCPVFELNDSCRTVRDTEQIIATEDLIDAIWEGKTL